MKLLGKKINLRKLKKSDALSIYKNINDASIKKYLLVPDPYKLTDAKKYIPRTQKKWRRGEGYSFGIEDKETKKIIGTISVDKINKEHKYAEIGYWLGKDYHRQGIMSEALSMVLDFAFRNLKLNCVWAGTFRPNKASQALLKKKGFKQVGVMENFFYRNGRWHDDMMWQLLRKNYKKAR